jgi:hypothetical protein
MKRPPYKQAAPRSFPLRFDSILSYPLRSFSLRSSDNRPAKEILK